MSDAPLISVIIPVYNTEAYLKQCLDSVCGQTYRHLEIICVNDGSTDSSLSILKEYAAKDSRIIVLEQPNRGQAAARNNALHIATGKWITGIDADDYLHPSAYEYALSLATPEVDMICFSSSAIGAEAAGQRKSEVPNLINTLDGVIRDSHQLLTQTNVYFWNKLWNKAFIDRYQLRFNENLWYEDAAFAYSALPLVKAAAFGKRVVHHYRMHAQSTMSKTFNKNERALEHLDQLDHVLAFYTQHNIAAKLPEAIPFVFESFLRSTLGHIKKSLKKRALSQAAGIAEKYNLHTTYRESPAIAATQKLPWYIKPFKKMTFRKKTYCFFFLPVYTQKYKPHTISHKLFGLTLRKTPRT